MVATESIEPARKHGRLASESFVSIILVSLAVLFATMLHLTNLEARRDNQISRADLHAHINDAENRNIELRRERTLLQEELNGLSTRHSPRGTRR